MRFDVERIVEEYSNLMLRLSFSYRHSVHDAKDVCQNVLLKLLLRDEPFEDAEHEKAWIIRVAVNERKNELKSARRKKSAPIDEAINSIFEAEESTDRLEVLDAVFSLPPDQASAVYLHYYEGYKIAEVAELLGKSNAAVSMNLSRARVRLRGKLGEEADCG